MGLFSLIVFLGSYTYDEVGVKRPSFVFVCFFLSNHLEGEGIFSGELLALVVYVGKGAVLVSSLSESSEIQLLYWKISIVLCIQVMINRVNLS